MYMQVKTKTRKFRKFRTQIDKNYESKLNNLLDDLYEHVYEVLNWDAVEFAEQARVSLSTIYNLSNRSTRLPRLMTVFKLCQAVGWERKCLSI